MPSNDLFVVSLDIGSSSVRALLFDASGQPCEGFSEQIAYEMTTTLDGGVEVDAAKLASLTLQCLSALHAKIEAANIRPAAVAGSAFWHSFLGVDANGRPTTPILHLFDTRAAAAAGELASELDAAQVHQRTGCRLHSSYWPAKLRWLGKTRPEAVRATARWMSFPEYLLLQVCGEAVCSVSMMSASGLWHLEKNIYDAEVLAAIPLREDQLWPAARMDEAPAKLLPEHAAKWPRFDGIPWYPAYGDGACSNIGANCVTPEDFCLMVGTSGAMRAVTGARRIIIPNGLWCYRVDAARYILGGALTNGGDVYAWMSRNLKLPGDAEAQIARRRPGEHGLAMLPFFGGERSPYWRADLRGAITGLGLTTAPVDILQAALESVALSFEKIFALLRTALGSPRRVVASGGALQHSRVWTQMMADALDVPVTLGNEKEASARGAALLALERLGRKTEVVPSGEVFQPGREAVGAFRAIRAAREDLFERLYKET
ncbi:MAG TPA: gluconokinase [Bryobacteraceae bacterium]|nr:gluconokinase [Bryobacteraceae bacterium]